MNLLSRAALETQGIFSDARQKLRWGFQVRIAISAFSCLSLAFSYLMNGQLLLPYYFLIGFLFFYNGTAYLIYQFNRKRLNFWNLVALHFTTQILDILLITILIYLTGLLDSPYWFLYLVLIILSGFGLFSAYTYAVFFVAVASMLFYVGLLFLVYSGILTPYGTGFMITPHQLLIAIFNRALYTTISLLLFSVTLFYFSKNINLQRAALADQNRQLLRLVEELKVLSQMKDDLIANVSHELRTPLAIVKDGILMVLDGIPGAINDKQREYLGNAKESIDRLTRIISNLLNIAKLENRSFEVSLAPLDLVPLAEKVVSCFKGSAKSAGLTLEFKPAQPIIKGLADADKLYEVFFNLIDDAVKFTLSGGRVVVGIKEGRDSIECYVQDTGPGIAKADQKKLFDRFSRLNMEPGKKGVGLGLAICKGIIELHHGKIWVESEPGKGTKFIFTLAKGEDNGS